MSYTPPKLKQPQPAADLPPDLQLALDNARSLLGDRDQLFAVVAKSHADIPRLLAERVTLQSRVGAVEMTGDGEACKSARAELDALEAERHRAIRARNAAFEGLLRQEAALVNLKGMLDTARAAYSARIAAEFRHRYDAAISLLQGLWREGAALALALRTAIEMPDPCRIEGGKDESVTPWPGVVTPAKLVRITGPDTPPSALDSPVVAIGETLDRLDIALRFCESIAQQKRLGQQLPSRIGSRTFDPSGVYRVAKELMNHSDGMCHQQGELVDGTLLSLSALSRRASVKAIILVETGKQAAA
jgi:hypothetical protein